jgi:hypothetical protein
VHQVPDAVLLPVAQSSPTGHPRSAAQFHRQQLPRNPAPQDEQIPVRRARSGTRGRPPFGRGGGTIRFHNASGSSTAAITADVTAAEGRRLSFTQFCYTLLVPAGVSLAAHIDPCGPAPRLQRAT